MKKSIVLILLILMLVLTSCSNSSNNSNKPSDNRSSSSNSISNIFKGDSPANDPKDAETDTADQPSNGSGDIIQLNECLELAIEGRFFVDIPGLGDLGEDLISMFGYPLDEGYFTGAYYYGYGDLFFLMDYDFLTDTPKEILRTAYVGDQRFFCLTIGMDIKEVYKILGNPDHEYIAEYSELYGEDTTVALYFLENVELALVFDKDYSKLQIAWLSYLR